MTRKLLLCAALLVAPSLASADNVGQCGWGSRLMAGNKGIIPQVAAVTTNGTFGNQTFGITSGTSGCTQDGVVSSNWKMSALVDSNKNKLARDMSRGNGETLESLAAVIGVQSSDKEAFFASAKANFSKVFPSHSVATADVVASINELVLSTPELAKYRSTL